MESQSSLGIARLISMGIRYLMSLIFGANQQVCNKMQIYRRYAEFKTLILDQTFIQAMKSAAPT